MAHDDAVQDPLDHLVDAFRSLLDPALIAAIASDHDLKTSDGYETAESICHQIAQDVVPEEATGFNPSGIPMLSDESGETTNEQQSSSTSLSQVASPGRHVATSSTSDSYAAVDLPAPETDFSALNQESEDSKLALLYSMFADLKEHRVNLALRKANGDFQIALDDLLNIQYLQSTGQQVKGIDGFFRVDDTPQRRGKKSRRPHVPRLETDVGSSDSMDFHLTAKHLDDIASLAAMLDIDQYTIIGFYRRSGKSKGGAAMIFLDQCISQGIQAQSEEDKLRAVNLSQQYRNIPEKYMATIIQVTDSASQSSDELAALLSKHLAKNPQARKLDVNWGLTPLPQEDLDGQGTTGTMAKSPVSASGSRTPNSAISPSPYSLGEAITKSSQHNQARRSAMESASAMWRKGGSNPLYRQGAVVYTDMAREQGAFAQQATSTAADLLVASQSRTNSIDLHGVTVADGVRIARRDVRAWWDGLGEYRLRKARENGFSVITGLGRHSSGGVSQMRRAVAAALVQDGWNMRVETGHFVVTGRKGVS